MIFRNVTVGLNITGLAISKTKTRSDILERKRIGHGQVVVKDVIPQVTTINLIETASFFYPHVVQFD